MYFVAVDQCAPVSLLIYIYFALPKQNWIFWIEFLQIKFACFFSDFRFNLFRFAYSVAILLLHILYGLIFFLLKQQTSITVYRWPTKENTRSFFVCSKQRKMPFSVSSVFRIYIFIYIYIYKYTHIHICKGGQIAILVRWSAVQRTTEMLADQRTGKNSGPAPADYRN
jgi:hypothetical protein